MRVFKTKLIRLQLTAEELDALTADFISYKRDGVLPDIFGRDALYDDSFTWPLIKFERVAHIHLANVNNPFPPQLRQFSRTNDEAHLVYCQGAFDEQAWLLIAILKLINRLEITTKCIKLGKWQKRFACVFEFIL